ncbi:unknown protein [Microcystis aeruginosa NIES-843]|uniref:Uncharacterized protein n=1 Tax=Microcystis aeruginosa (strain NIES-843 / IAM M-2473) TaxID=449447 RepID=B0JTN9_MICAN|nr:unknown protein [Microcystis aeruginosa NIES-843]
MSNILWLKVDTTLGVSPVGIVSKSIVKYRQTEFHFRNSFHFYFERLILLG